MVELSPNGGTGRRARLKIWLSQGSAGSIPVPGTKMRKGAVSESEPSLSHFSLAPALFLALKFNNMFSYENLEVYKKAKSLTSKMEL